jgi:hypothetical protein
MGIIIVSERIPIYFATLSLKCVARVMTGNDALEGSPREAVVV